MKVSSICNGYNHNITSRNSYSQNKNNRVSKSNISFNGELGQQVGAAAGMLAGVAASFVVGPIAACAVSLGGLIVGAAAGDKIEDDMDENNRNNKK